MSQTSAPMSPNPMKKKVIMALAAVAIGHMGVLWAVGQMKTPELKPIEKDPIQVRFVKLEEAPKPLPPKPKPPEPKKEPPKPKEVKIVDKPLPPPKKVEKVEQVKKAVKPKPVEKPTETPTPVVSSTISETKRPVPETPVQKPEPQPKADPQPKPDPAPKNVSIGGGVSWLKQPNIRFSPGELKSSCSLNVSISADENGQVVSATARNSSCGAAVDRKVTAAVKRAKLTKYVENGVAYPTKVEQPFDFQLK